MCHFCVLCPFSHFVFIGHMYFNAILPLVWFVVFLFSLFRLRFFFFLLSFLVALLLRALSFVLRFLISLVPVAASSLSFVLFAFGAAAPLLECSSLFYCRRCFVVVVSSSSSCHFALVDDGSSLLSFFCTAAAAREPRTPPKVVAPLQTNWPGHTGRGDPRVVVGVLSAQGPRVAC